MAPSSSSDALVTGGAAEEAQEAMVPAAVAAEADEAVAAPEGAPEAAPVEDDGRAPWERPSWDCSPCNVELRPGDDARLVFRPVPGLRCGDKWRDVPLRAPPLVGGSAVGVLAYWDDSTAFMDGDLNLLHAVFRDHGFAKAQSFDDEWCVFWHSGLFKPHELALLSRLKRHQRVNKLPGAGALTLKTRLWESFDVMQRQHGEAAFGFMPRAFVLPAQAAEYEALMNSEAERGVPSWWILKPAERQRGTGIFLHEAKVQTGWGGSYGGIWPHHVRRHIGVACRYIDPPLLVDGLKFDVRLYVLVTSVCPLVVYLYRDGLARFATEQYDLGASGSVDRRCMHVRARPSGVQARSPAAARPPYPMRRRVSCRNCQARYSLP